MTKKAIKTETKKETKKGLEQPLPTIEINKELADKCKQEGNLLFKMSNFFQIVTQFCRGF